MEHWEGTVTVGNIEEVAERFKELLTGKRYTTVHCHEYKNFKPEVRLHQELGGGWDGETIVVTHHHKREDRSSDRPRSRMTLCDTHVADGFSTTRVEPGYDPDFQAPYVVFEWNKVTITNRAPNGLLYYAVYAVED